MNAIPSTRASLLVRLRDPRDHAAWVEFVTLYEPAVYRFLRRTGLQDADAREVLQDVFLAVSRSVERWDADPQRGSFRGWLSRVARNLVISRVRSRQHGTEAAGGTDAHLLLSEIPGPTDSESLDYDRELNRSRFRQASARVQSEFSSQVWRAFWETAVLGRTPGAVGQTLQMSVGAVRVAKCRVLARLKEEIAAANRSLNDPSDRSPDSRSSIP